MNYFNNHLFFLLKDAQKRCFNNILKTEDTKIYEPFEDCYSISIDDKLFTEAGFAVTRDSTGNIYVVRAYFTKQNSKNKVTVIITIIHQKLEMKYSNIRILKTYD